MEKGVGRSSSDDLEAPVLVRRRDEDCVDDVHDAVRREDVGNRHAGPVAAFKARVRSQFKSRIRNYILGTIIHVTDNAIERKHVEAVVAGRDVSDKRGGWRTPYKERLKRAERNDRRLRRGDVNAGAEASCVPRLGREYQFAHSRRGPGAG